MKKEIFDLSSKKMLVIKKLNDKFCIVDSLNRYYKFRLISPEKDEYCFGFTKDNIHKFDTIQQAQEMIDKINKE